MSKKQSASDPLKRFLSPNYRRAVKRLTEAIKNLRGLSRIPNAPQRPARDKKKQEAFDATGPRLSKATVHYFLEAATFDEVRRMRSPGERIDDALAEKAPKDSVRY